MSRKITGLPLAIVAFIAGAGGYHFWLSYAGSTVSEVQEQEPLYWVAPMDPNYRRDKPGKSPMGMDLVPVYQKALDKEQFPGTVSVSPVVENNLGVRSVAARRQLLTPQVKTVGRVLYDEDSLVQLNSRVDCWVENLAVASSGEFVEKGSRLFNLYSPTLVNAQEELLAAMASGSSALIRASRERLISLDVPQQTIDRIAQQKKIQRTLPFYAARAGYISQLAIRDGSYVTPAKTLIELASLDEVWVMADVFERQSHLVKKGQAAFMSIDYLPGKLWQGTVDYVYPELDPRTRSLRVRLKFPNPDSDLKPNMYSQVRIDLESFFTLTVPAEAVIETEELQRVVRALGDGRYRSVKVSTGRQVGDQVEVLKGLLEGDRVVTSAQFLLDSESSITADLTRFEAEQVIDHSGHDMGSMPMNHSTMDHSGHDMGSMPMDHSAMDHSGHDMGSMPMDHSTMDHSDHDMGSMPMDHSAMDHSGHDMGSMPMDHSTMDHSDHDMGSMPMDHSAMDHSGHDMGSMPMNHSTMDHSGHDMGSMPMDHSTMDHSGHDMGSMPMDHSTMDHSGHDMGSMPMDHNTMDHKAMGH